MTSTLEGFSADEVKFIIHGSTCSVLCICLFKRYSKCKAPGEKFSQFQTSSSRKGAEQLMSQTRLCSTKQMAYGNLVNCGSLLSLQGFRIFVNKEAF